MIQISSTATLFTFNSQVPWGIPAHQLLEWPICEALMEPTSLLLMQEMGVEMPQCATGKAEGEAGSMTLDKGEGWEAAQWQARWEGWFHLCQCQSPE